MKIVKTKTNVKANMYVLYTMVKLKMQWIHEFLFNARNRQHLYNST